MKQKYREAGWGARGEILPTEKPTHICIDCGAVGRGGVYHNHGDLYAAGEIHPISDVLRWAREFLEGPCLPPGRSR